MALTLISRSPRRVGIAMTATKDEFFYPDTGYGALNTGWHPAHIKVPKGVWTLTATGEALKSVWYQKTQVTSVATGGRFQVTRYFDGSENILVNATGPGTCTIVLEEAPPLRKCLLARLGVALWR